MYEQYWTTSIASVVFTHIKGNGLACCSIPPIVHAQMAALRAGRRLLESDVVHKRYAIVRGQTFSPPCFENAHFKARESYTLDPCNRGVMDEIAGIVEVVDRCMYVDSRFVTLKTCGIEVNRLALHIGCAQTQCHAPTFHDKC